MCYRWWEYIASMGKQMSSDDDNDNADDEWTNESRGWNDGWMKTFSLIKD